MALILHQQSFLTLLQDPKLQLELAAVIDWWAICKSKYYLESDGALVFTGYDVISSLGQSVTVNHFPNLKALVAKLSSPWYVLGLWEKGSLRAKQNS